MSHQIKFARYWALEEAGRQAAEETKRLEAYLARTSREVRRARREAARAKRAAGGTQ